MIVNIRIEIDDEQRNVLARRNKPTAPKRLASRKEVTAFVEQAIADLVPPEPKAPVKPDLSKMPDFTAGFDTPQAPARNGHSAGYHVTNAMHSMGAACRLLFSHRNPAANVANNLSEQIEGLWRELADQGGES